MSGTVCEVSWHLAIYSSGATIHRGRYCWTHGKHASIPHVAGSQPGLAEHGRRSKCGVTPTDTHDSGGGHDRVAHWSSALPRVGAISVWCQATSTSPGTSTGTTSASTFSTYMSLGTTSNSSRSKLHHGKAGRAATLSVTPCYVRARGPPRTLDRSKRFSENNAKATNEKPLEVSAALLRQRNTCALVWRRRPARFRKIKTKPSTLWH